MKNPPPGKEWMGLTKSQMMQGAKAYKFKKSAGANASAKRFGTDEPAPKKSVGRRSTANETYFGMTKSGVKARQKRYKAIRNHAFVDKYGK